jgi:hypothetical protein
MAANTKKNGTKKAAGPKAVKKAIVAPKVKASKAAKKAAPTASKPSKHAYWGGWNREQTSLLMYDAKGEWTGKLTAGSLVSRLEAGESLQPLSKMNPERRAVDLKEVKARAGELAKSKE